MVSDADVVPRVAHSTPQSPERWALLMPHRARLVRLAASKLGNPRDAEDCAHETMLRTVAFAGLDDNRVGPFLTAVTVRLCADWHRSRARGWAVFHRLWDGAQHDSPEDAVCDRLAGAWLQNQLCHLSERERTVIQARAEGLSTAEAALRLGITLKAAESAFTRARAKMLSYADPLAA